MSRDPRERDPGTERFNAIAQAVVISLVGCIVGFVAAGLLSSMSEPAGWALITLGASTGLVPLGRWLRSDRGRHRLDLTEIERPLRPLLLQAAAATERIERAATAAPDGPVSDLLSENHRSALAHLKLLEHDARAAGTNSKPEILRVCHQLDELALTSEQLLRTTLESQPTVLNALAERTSLVNESLAATKKNGDEPAVSEASAEPGPEDHGATNDR